MSLTCTSVSPCIALGTGAPAAGRGGGYTKGKSLVLEFCGACVSVFFINKKGGRLAFFFVFSCLLKVDYTKYYCFFLVWGGEGMRSMMPREVYDNGAADPPVGPIPSVFVC